jgi:O-antigen/teichoic acid export membrane protein
MLIRTIKERKIFEILSSLRSANKREWIALVATFFSMFNKFISLLSIFFYVRWTLPYLGNAKFGVWMTMSTIITFVNIFSDFGLGSSLVNHVASSKAKRSFREIKAFTSSAFFFLTMTGLILGLVFYLFKSDLLSVMANGIDNARDISEVQNGLMCLFFFFLVSLPFVIIDKTLEGLQLTYISSIWIATGNLISLIVMYFFTQKSLGIFWLVLGTVGIQSLFRIAYFFIEFNGRLFIAKPSFKNISLKKASSLLRFGLVFFILNIFNVLAFQFDNILISKELGVSNVALFSLMQKLVTISFFFWFYTSSLWPAFAEAYSKGDKEWIKKTVKFMFILNSILGLVFGLVIVFLSKNILELWSKGAVPSPTFTMCLGFALYILLNGLIGVIAIIFNTGPLIKKQVLGFCLACISTITLKYLLIGPLGIDYLMYLPILPFLCFYIIPCYLKYKNYVNS